MERILSLDSLDLSTRLKLLRILKRCVRAELAEEVGIGISTLARYESGMGKPRAKSSIEQRIEELENEALEKLKKENKVK